MECMVIQRWMQNWTKSLLANTDYLNQIDTVIGDGDHGTNMARGAQAIQDMLQQKYTDEKELLHKIAMVLLTKVGGASGVIYGTAFLEMSKQTAIGPMLDAGIKGIIKRGKAEIGDKTLLDVWVPLTEDIASGILTKEKIEVSVQATKPLLAKRGRAEFVGDASIGYVDPGSVSSGYLFQGLLKELEK